VGSHFRTVVDQNRSTKDNDGVKKFRPADASTSSLVLNLIPQTKRKGDKHLNEETERKQFARAEHCCSYRPWPGSHLVQNSITKMYDDVVTSSIYAQMASHWVSPIYNRPRTQSLVNRVETNATTTCALVSGNLPLKRKESVSPFSNGSENSIGLLTDL